MKPAILEVGVYRIAAGHAVWKGIVIRGLKSQRVTADDGREGQAACQCEDFSNLPARGCPFCWAVPRATAGNIPDRVDYADVPHIEIRKSPAQSRIKKWQAGYGISKRVASDSRRTRINALRECVRALELEPVTQPFVALQFQSMINGFCRPCIGAHLPAEIWE